MNFLRLLPVFISCVLLAAHFMHAGLNYLVVTMLVLPFLLLITKPWVVIVIQWVMVLGAVEWIRTLVAIAVNRIEFGQPWLRMVIILAVVALFTALSSLIFRNKSIRKRYSNLR